MHFCPNSRRSTNSNLAFWVSLQRVWHGSLYRCLKLRCRGSRVVGLWAEMHLAGIYKGRQGRLEFGSIVAAQRNTRTGHGFPSLLSTISPARGVAIAGEGNRSGTIVTRIAGENAQQMAWRCLIRLRRVVELNSEALQFTHVSVTILQRTRHRLTCICLSMSSNTLHCTASIGSSRRNLKHFLISLAVIFLRNLCSRSADAAATS